MFDAAERAYEMRMMSEYERQLEDDAIREHMLDELIRLEQPPNGWSSKAIELAYDVEDYNEPHICGCGREVARAFVVRWLNCRDQEVDEGCCATCAPTCGGCGERPSICCDREHTQLCQVCALSRGMLDAPGVQVVTSRDFTVHNRCRVEVGISGRLEVIVYNAEFRDVARYDEHGWDYGRDALPGMVRAWVESTWVEMGMGVAS